MVTVASPAEVDVRVPGGCWGGGTWDSAVGMPFETGVFLLFTIRWRCSQVVECINNTFAFIAQ